LQEDEAAELVSIHEWMILRLCSLSNVSIVAELTLSLQECNHRFKRTLAQIKRAKRGNKYLEEAAGVDVWMDIAADGSEAKMFGKNISE